MPNCKCCGKPVTGGVVLHSECYDFCVMGSADGGRTEASAPTGWIPVTERLPECFKRVLVCREGLDEPIVEQGSRDVNGWWKVYGTRTKKVTHWMPLPEPPVGDSPC